MVFRCNSPCNGPIVQIAHLNDDNAGGDGDGPQFKCFNIFANVSVSHRRIAKNHVLLLLQVLHVAEGQATSTLQ